jgi:ubiquinone/menaquinone biosynthesis C-methylase UbiE
MKSPTSFEEARTMVACLEEGAPYSEAARDFVRASIELPCTPFADTIRVAACYNVFHATERILTAPDDPVPPFETILNNAAAMLENTVCDQPAFTTSFEESYASVEEETSSHYGSLFREFDNAHYYDEAARLLRERLERNGFDMSYPRGRTALDVGCGGGRYTVALRRLGFAHVTGIDFSTEGIVDSKQRLCASGIQGVSFQQANALSLPFRNDYFDFVFCNGLLHHTVDMPKGVRELVRVLKPGGRGFLYVIENPGGIFWDVIEILRPMMRHVSYAFARSIFSAMGVPSNRRYYILDHIMAPINIRSTPVEVLAMLQSAGASNIRRLTRGTDFDRIERCYQGEPYAAIKYGVGENRYFFEKPALAD